MKQITNFFLTGIATIVLSGFFSLNGVTVRIGLIDTFNVKTIELPLATPLKPRCIRQAISNAYDQRVPEGQITDLCVSHILLDLRDGAALIDPEKIAQMTSSVVNYVLLKPGFKLKE